MDWKDFRDLYLIAYPLAMVAALTIAMVAYGAVRLLLS